MRSSLRFAYCLLASAAFVFGGCSRESDVIEKEALTPASTNKVSAAIVPVRESEKGIWTNNPIVVRIDGKALTRKDVLRNGKVMLLLNLNKSRRTKLGKRDWKYLARYCKDTDKREIGRAAVRKYLEDHNLKPDTNTVARQTRDFARRYGIKSKKLKRWHTIDDLKFMVGKRNAFRIDAELQDRINYAMATNDMIQANAAAVAVTDSMIRERLDSLRAYNVRAQATNEFAFAKATNVWREVTAQTNKFESLAERFSEDEYISMGCEWGQFTLSNLSDETALLKLLPTMKIGDITPPIESDGGLAIIRLDETDSQGNYTFSRIFFRLPMFYEEETPDVARKEIRSQNERKFISKTLKDIASVLKVEHPDGTNVFSFVKGSVVASPKEFETCDR